MAIYGSLFCHVVFYLNCHNIMLVNEKKNLYVSIGYTLRTFYTKNGTLVNKTKKSKIPGSKFDASSSDSIYYQNESVALDSK